MNVFVVEYRKVSPYCNHPDVTVMHIASHIGAALLWIQTLMHTKDMGEKDPLRPWWLQVVRDEVDGDNTEVVGVVDWNGTIMNTLPDYHEPKLSWLGKRLAWLNKRLVA